MTRRENRRLDKNQRPRLTRMARTRAASLPQALLLLTFGATVLCAHAGPSSRPACDLSLHFSLRPRAAAHPARLGTFCVMKSLQTVLPHITLLHSI